MQFVNDPGPNDLSPIISPRLSAANAYRAETLNDDRKTLKANMQNTYLRLTYRKKENQCKSSCSAEERFSHTTKVVPATKLARSLDRNVTTSLAPATVFVALLSNLGCT
jgi:hypothetical protein